MKRSKIIGLTGSIATGKSTLVKYLKSKGYPIVDADAIARTIYLKGRPAYAPILEAFGKEMLDEEGQIDRQRLGALVFSDQEKMQRLNDITHPLIFQAIEDQIEAAQQGKSTLIFVDIPLLFEKNRQGRFDEVWVVYVNEATQLQRLMNRDHFDESEALLRIKGQISIEEKAKMGDRLIDNSQSPEATFKRVDEILEALEGLGNRDC